ncbi:hypothetical protein EJ06DRAFT_534825 [Trichodelitschia bisporula]|uniref:Alpha-1,3-mannosyltransferase n=1 Tax=Trichodelitschia bisporula TaxID=703511 RepID=A0A6G1HIG2_9PEZI|nr:hypothetical protein EJ06DRAFT_534825 [Trichodelitschia bisporula]
MPPALHPRSHLTLSLFTSTLALSFLVVGVPHLLPCPVPLHALAETDDPNAPRRRRRRIKPAEGADNEPDPEAVAGMAAERKRECPVPKPGGLVGQVLGFKRDEGGALPIRIARKGDSEE